MVFPENRREIEMIIDGDDDDDVEFDDADGWSRLGRVKLRTVNQH